MKIGLVVTALALALTGCSSAASDAEAQYEIANRSGELSDKCDAANRTAAAYLSAKDEENYQRWKAIASNACYAAARGF